MMQKYFYGMIIIKSCIVMLDVSRVDPVEGPGIDPWERCLSLPYKLAQFQTKFTYSSPLSGLEFAEHILRHLGYQF